MEGEVISLAFGGYAVVKKGKDVFFLSGALPDEIVDFSIDFKRKGVNFGVAKKIIKSSEARVEPKCKYFLKCGGCNFQNLNYEQQLIEKEKILKEILKKIGNLEARFEKPIFSKEYGYRKKVQFEINDEGKICFFKRNSNKLIEINECPVLSKPLELFLKRINKNNLKFFDTKNLTLYLSKSIVGRIETTEENLLKFWRNLKKISLKGLWLKPKKGFGKYLIKRNFEKYFLYHSPFSFMQINEEVNKFLIDEILNYLKDYNDLNILDGFAGVGNFSVPLSLKFKNVFAVENSKSNFYLLQRNKEDMKIENLNLINKNFEEVDLKERIDLILVDPPREGLTKGSIEKILSFLPEFLIYISCEPSTFARDLKIIKKFYSIEYIKLVDMFPQTYHTEAVCFLRKL